MFAHAIGTPLLLAWLPLFVVGAARMLGRRPRWPAWFLATLPLVMTPLYWLSVPDNVDSRFMLPIVLVVLIPLAFVFTERGNAATSRWNTAIHVVYGAVFLWPFIGINREIPAHLPWFMGGWLSLRGLVAPERLPLMAIVAVLSATAWLLAARWIRPALSLAVIALGSVMLTLWPQAGCGGPDCDYLQTTSIFLRQSFLDARQWIEGHVTHVTFAYAGNNVPYLLVDPHLTNRVYYVNIDRHPAWRFHDYDRAARQRVTESGAEPLARSSGVLLPLDRQSGAVDAVRPRFERMRGDQGAWVDNLRLAGVDRLFVSALSAYEIDYLWHDDRGFPIEDTWARADPQMFTLLYENPQVRIYAVRKPLARP
jgi:hypothetical protein